MNFSKNPQVNWKYVLIVVILAAIVAGGIWIYFGNVLENIISFSQFSKKRDSQNYFSSEIIPETISLKVAEEEIANWKTFNNEKDNFNEKYKYEIKYPQNFSIFQANKGKPLIVEHEINFTVVIDWQEEMMRPGLFLEFFDSGNVSLINWLKQVWGLDYIRRMSQFDVEMSLGDLNNIIKKREKLTINGFQAIKLPPSPFKPPEFIFIYNGKDKIVKATCNDPNIGNTLKICNQMLSTFRFLK